MSSTQNPRSWQERAAEARAHRDASLNRIEPALERLPDKLPLNSQGLAKAVLTQHEIEITEGYSITELLTALRERKLSVEEVTRAFLRRAALAQFATNCVTELLWDEAIARARELDALSAPKGKLFGLPVSAKEHHGYTNKSGKFASNASYVSWIDKEHDSMLLYDLFWEEGVVYYVRTTQPQLIMHLETESNIYGRTVNPYNRELTCGGSTGGEAALLAMRGSIMGIGGDIGGSIRCPSAHCADTRPTCKRIPVGGQRIHMLGKETVLSTLGPMARDREGLDLFMNVILAQKPWRLDPSLTTKDWTPYSFAKPLKVAVQWWDGVVQPHPPMIRALREVADACRRAGMTVVDWDCEALDHRRGWELTAALYWPDGGEEVLEYVAESGEPLLPLSKWIIHEQPSVRKMTQAELWKTTAERHEYQAKYAHAWTATGDEDGREIDVILCPPSFGAATPHEQSRYWGYTSHWNLLDYPGAVFPVTTVDPVKDARDVNYVPKNEEDKFVYEMYCPERYEGAPVSLQVIGRRHYDEKVIAALAQIEHALGRP